TLCTHISPLFPYTTLFRSPAFSPLKVSSKPERRVMAHSYPPVELSERPRQARLRIWSISPEARLALLTFGFIALFSFLSLYRQRSEERRVGKVFVLCLDRD